MSWRSWSSPWPGEGTDDEGRQAARCGRLEFVSIEDVVTRAPVLRAAVSGFTRGLLAPDDREVGLRLGCREPRDPVQHALWKLPSNEPRVVRFDIEGRLVTGAVASAVTLSVACALGADECQP
ncbi:MAG: hypothetical protein HYX57_01795 [Chloroflexi bacterium]|nr:hypothetical protein [Chloroflexota bacterium]